MDSHHKKYIIAHLDKLVQCTTCNALLLAKLRLHGILSANDCDSLDALKFEGKMSQSLKLYDVIITRTDSFDLLAQALRETGQTEAARILFEGSEAFQAISQLLYNDEESEYSSCQQLIPKSMNVPSAQIQNSFQSIEFHNKILNFLKEKRELTIISTIDLTLTSALLKITLENESTTLTTCFTSYPSNYNIQEDKKNTIIMIVTVNSNLEEFLSNFEGIANTQWILLTLMKPHEIIDTLKGIGNLNLLKKSAVTKHDINWEDVDQSLKPILLKRLVKFQNYEVPLHDVLSPCQESQVNLVRNNINEKLLIELFYDQKPDLCSNTIPPLPQKCYMPRKFCKKYVIKSFSIFQDDLVVVSGVGPLNFRIATKNWVVNVTEKQTEMERLKRDCNLILLRPDSLTDFEMFTAISKHFNRPDHWLKYVGTHFEHCLSLGLLQGSLSWELVKEIELFKSAGLIITGEDEILEQVGNEIDSIITIFSPPGTGKTTVLANIATKICSANPTHFVGFFDLGELTQNVYSQVGSSDGDLKLDDITSAMISNCSNYALMKHVIELKFGGGQEENNRVDLDADMDIFLDGHDEVPPDLFHFSIQIILELRRNTKNVRIWLSTTIEYLEFLQDCISLKLIQFQLEPLPSSELSEFLVNTWELEGIQKMSSLPTCATKCLLSIPRKLDLPENIPSLSLLILSNFGELFKDAALDYSALVEQGELIHLKNFSFPSSLAEMYSQLADLRMNQYLSKINIIYSSESDWYTRGRIRRLHMYLALQKLFPDWAHTFLPYFEHEKNGSPTELLPFRFIIQRGQSQSFQFIHSSIAEYFLALFVLELGTDIGYENVLGNSIGKFINDIIFSIKPDRWCPKQEYIVQFQYTRIVQFLNDMIDKKTLEEQQRFAKIVLKFRKVGKEYIVGNELSPIVAAIRCKASALFRIIFFDAIIEEQSLETVSKGDWDWDTRLLRICAKYSNLECFKMMEHIAMNAMAWGCLVTEIKLVLSEAVVSGNISVFNYLLHCRKIKRETWVNRSREDVGSYIHNCVQNSRNERKSVVKGKRKILQFFANASPSLINETDERGRTPLLMENVHIDLLQELIKAGANINAVEIKLTKNNVLHLLADSRVSPQDFHEFLLFCQAHGINLRLQNKKGETSFHIVLEKFEPLPASLDIYATSGLDFNTSNEEGNTLLHIAAKFGRSREIINALIQHGAKVDTRNKVGETFIHFLAQTVDLSTFKHFTEKTGSELLRTKSDDQNTVLHRALANKCSKNVVDLTNFLVNEIGLDPNFRNLKEETPLHFGIRYGGGNIKGEVILALEKAGADILGRDKEETLINLFVHGKDFEDNEFLAICNVLKEAGANFHCRWKNGVSLLHWAVRRRSLKVLKYLVEDCGVDVNATHECTGNTALHLVFEDKQIGLCNQDIALYLIEKGVDENQKNKWGENPVTYGSTVQREVFWSKSWEKSFDPWHEYLL
ncbi:unnamed protein product [Orchesella dallaii]|uniref:Uncharacterized protein n=1 Tax=Orchesella dallaii TaxID=48710 RepID=A0ABP1PPS5_9HEXA